MPHPQLEAALSEYCDKNRLSGVLRITCKDEILHRQSFGFADRERQLPFTADSVFTLYSMSKPFCAMGLLRLVDAGAVELDAHPGAYVPEAAGFDSHVTLRQLLQHTAGIPDFAPDTGYLTSCGDVRSDLQRLSAFPSHFAPEQTDGTPTSAISSAPW